MLRQQLEQSIDVQEVVDITKALVSIQSHRDAPGRERPCALKIAEILTRWGFAPQVVPVVEERPNVYCTLKGSGGGSALMFNGHIDTVPAYDMDIPPFTPEVRGGLLYGRGTVDMKSQLAAMMVAMKTLRDLGVPLRGDLIFTAVINEEDRSEGTEYLVRHGPKADRCVVGEPTGLAIMAGHRGLEWLEFTFQGKTAHGGSPEKGINAIVKAAKFVTRVEEKLMPELKKRVHPVIGPAVMNFGVIRGGTQPSSVAGECVVQIDRRWVPMETLDQVLNEYTDIIAELEAEDPTFRCAMRRMPSNMATMDHYPMEIALDDPLVTDLQGILVALLGREPKLDSFGGWTDASLISNFAGIPTLVFGPGDLSVAHSRVEYVPVEELRCGALAYALLAESICNRKAGTLTTK